MLNRGKTFWVRGFGRAGAGEFIRRLEEYLEYYREGRIKRSLGWMSPNEYRRSLGYAA